MTRRYPYFLAAAIAAMLVSTAALAAPAAEKAGPAVPAKAAEKAAPDKEGVALTVYNQNFGVVKDVRSLEIDKATGIVRFRDVAKQIDATSVHFKSLTDPEGTTVLEQNYEFDLVNADKLLDKYIDKKIQVITKQAGSYEGTLLSFDAQQIILQSNDRALFMIQRPDNVQNVIFGSLPEGLLTRPTLVWKVATEKPGKQMVQVTYQTQGMSWRSDYNVIVNAADTQMDLTGWVTLTNQSGAAYKDAQVKLIAGDVRRIQPPRPVPAARPAGGAMAMARMAEPAFEEKAFFEYHMYTLGRPTTVDENQIKQIELLSASDVPVTKRYVFEPNGRFWHPRYGDPNLFKVNVYIELKNSKESKLGMPLPKGKVRVYKRDPADNALEFVGEDEIDHTPKDEQLKLYVGDAFDLVGSRTVTDHQQGDRWSQDSIKIELRNHKDEAAVIRVREHMNGGQWDISKNEPEFKKIDAQTIEFDVPVKANGDSTVTYTVRYRY